MYYQEAKPGTQFQSTVDRYWSIESEGGPGDDAEPILPDGCPEIVFNLADPFKRVLGPADLETQSTAIVSGQLRKSVLVIPTGRVRLFGIRFLPHAAHGFLRIAMSSLTDHVVPLESVISRVSDELESEIAKARSFVDRIAVFERYLEMRQNPTQDESAKAGGLVSMVMANGGRSTVRELAQISGLGERSLERVFEKHVGVSPKVLSRIVRFSRLVKRIETSGPRDLADSALMCGYYDQAHMIHEFNQIAGTTPLKYLQQKHRLSELFTVA